MFVIIHVINFFVLFFKKSTHLESTIYIRCCLRCKIEYKIKDFEHNKCQKGQINRNSNVEICFLLFGAICFRFREVTYDLPYYQFWTRR